MARVQSSGNNPPPWIRRFLGGRFGSQPLKYPSLVERDDDAQLGASTGVAPVYV